MGTEILIIVLTLIVLGAIMQGLPYLEKFAKKKNINIENTLETTEQVTRIITNLLKNSNLLQGNQQDFIMKVASAANLAVRYAEQLYKSGQCGKEERKEKATEFIIQVLLDSGIEITPERKDVISKTIEAAVFLLSK